MKTGIKRATGLLVIEVVSSNPNGDSDRESDPRQRANGLGGISPVSFKRKLRNLLEDHNAPFFAVYRNSFCRMRIAIRFGTSGQRQKSDSERNGRGGVAW